MYRLFTHNDLDGVGCGILFKLAFGEKAEVRYNSVAGLNYQVERYFDRMTDHMKNDDFLFITDLSVNVEVAGRINQFVSNGGKAQLIDHHKTALHFNDYPWGYVKVEDKTGKLTSATSLLYKYLIQYEYLKNNGSLDEFVELVRQYDTWEWDINKNYKAKNLNDLFFMVSIEEFEERVIQRLEKENQFEFDEFEQKLLNMEEDKIERYIRRKKREIVQIFVNGLYGGIVHAESYHSELGNELGKEFSHLDYIAILNLGGKKISFRTIHDNVDVSAVAGEFGGGGHAKAAGCTMNGEAFTRYIDQAFRLDSLRQDSKKNIYNKKAAKHGCMYDNHDHDEFFIYEKENKYYCYKNTDEKLGPFNNFAEAERHIKRKFGAALARDEVYIGYLEQIVYRLGTTKTPSNKNA